MNSFFDLVSISDFSPLAILTILTATALTVLLVGVFSGKPRHWVYELIAISGLGLAIAQVCCTPYFLSPLLSGTIAIDTFSRFLSVLILGATIGIVLISSAYRAFSRVRLYEYYTLLIFAATGMILVIASTDLIALFLGIEIMSISTYILCGMLRFQKQANEASLKYFILGAFSTGFLLYGIALVYGATGYLEFDRIAALSQEALSGSRLYLLGFGFMIVAFGFKIASAPFHMWAPDVYQGAPTPITAFMATLIKASAFAGFLRILLMNHIVIDFYWMPLLWTIAALTMTLGNVAALKQSNIKRMIAYSSISHAGYILVGVLATTSATTDPAISSILFYLLAYTLTTIGALAILVILGDNLSDFEHFSGLSTKRPVLALLLSVFMISLAGVPPTGGFIAKFYIFRSAIDSGLLALVIIAILNSVVSVYYYLRIVVHMYFKEQSHEFPTHQPLAAFLVLTVCFLGILFLGIFPASFITLTQLSQLAQL